VQLNLAFYGKLADVFEKFEAALSKLLLILVVHAVEDPHEKRAFHSWLVVVRVLWFFIRVLHDIGERVYKLTIN